LQANLSKLLTYSVLKSTQPPTLSGRENGSLLMGYEVKALFGWMVGRGSSMFAGCSASPTVR